jgi:hypothetical protein
MNIESHPHGAWLFFAFMLSSSIQELLAAGIIFLIGVLVRSKINWGKTNSDVLETVTKDYQTLRALYDAKCEDIKRKDEQIITVSEDLLQAKARITSYENFLQSRTLETDNLLKQVPHILVAIANHLSIPLMDEGLNAHESAHSQEK